MNNGGSENYSDYNQSNLSNNLVSENEDNLLQRKETQPYYMNVPAADVPATNSTSIKILNQTNFNYPMTASDNDQLKDGLIIFEPQEHYENVSPKLQDKMHGRPASLNNGLDFVNYIVLDLDNSDSPLPHNTMNRTNFANSELLFLTESADCNAVDDEESVLMGNSPSKRSTPTMSSINTTMTTLAGAINSNVCVESYSTIDFVRTSALLNQSNEVDNCDKNEQCEEEERESRLTRHSKYISRTFNTDDQVEK